METTNNFLEQVNKHGKREFRLYDSTFIVTVVSRYSVSARGWAHRHFLGKHVDASRKLSELFTFSQLTELINSLN